MCLHRSCIFKAGLAACSVHQGEGQFASGDVTHTLLTVLTIVLTAQSPSLARRVLMFVYGVTYPERDQEREPFFY